MASGQLLLFALITLVVANVAAVLSMEPDIPQVVRRNPRTEEDIAALAWPQIDEKFFEVMRSYYNKPTSDQYVGHYHR
jgi:hypothetical protein